MKVKMTAALLIALAIAIGSCGGGNDDEPSADRVATTGTTGATQSQGTERSSEAEPETSAGTGGSRAPKDDEKRASKPDGDSSSGSGKSGESGDGSSDKPTGTATTVEDLSPAQREALHKDLYKQGRDLCQHYAPGELAEQYNIQSNKAEVVAREYAELYEQGNPSLVLPYQQGCLAGFEIHAKKKRNAVEGTGS